MSRLLPRHSSAVQISKQKGNWAGLRPRQGPRHKSRPTHNSSNRRTCNTKLFAFNLSLNHTVRSPRVFEEPPEVCRYETWYPTHSGLVV